MQIFAQAPLVLCGSHRLVRWRLYGVMEKYRYAGFHKFSFSLKTMQKIKLTWPRMSFKIVHFSRENVRKKKTNKQKLNLGKIGCTPSLEKSGYFKYTFVQKAPNSRVQNVSVHVRASFV